MEKIKVGSTLDRAVIVATDSKGNTGFVSGDTWAILYDAPQKIYDLKQAKRILATYLNWQKQLQSAKTNSDASQKEYALGLKFKIHSLTLGTVISENTSMKLITLVKK